MEKILHDRDIVWLRIPPAGNSHQLTKEQMLEAFALAAMLKQLKLNSTCFNNSWVTSTNGQAIAAIKLRCRSHLAAPLFKTRCKPGAQTGLTMNFISCASTPGSAHCSKLQSTTDISRPKRGHSQMAPFAEGRFSKDDPR